MEEFGLPYLDLVHGRRLAFIRWAAAGYLLSVKTTPPWRALGAAVQNAPGARDPFLYDSVINQLRVAEHPRYRHDQQGLDETYCNIFVWDVTRAMGAEIPHWVDAAGNPAPDGTGRELDANALIEWLESCGPAHGWEPVDEEAAQSLANRGRPVVAAWVNPGGIGHVAIVRPGEISDVEGPVIAQSGARNFNRGTVEQGFRRRAAGRDVRYFSHR
jgi:hypothetical protein